MLNSLSTKRSGFGYVFQTHETVMVWFRKKLILLTAVMLYSNDLKICLGFILYVSK